MNKLLRFSLGVAGLTGPVLGACFAIGGCGSGNSTSPNGQVADASGADSTTDAPSEAATADVTQGDVAQETSVRGDAGDGGGLDASDASDASDAAPLTLLDFPQTVATAVCRQLAACCTTVDASAVFNTNGCITSETPTGYSETLLGSAGLLDSGLLTLNSAKAQACLNDINGIDCTANELTAATQIAILDDCTSAITGVLEAGAPCEVSIVCGAGQYCNTPTDGGAIGTCTPLQPDGGPCGFGSANYGTSEEACSFRRSGNTGMRCDNATGHSTIPASTWVCAPAFEAGTVCNFNEDCQSQLCNTNGYLCADSVPAVTASVCATFTAAGPVDAGGD